MLGVLAIDLVLVALELRLLVLHPAPPFARASMRRFAFDELAVPHGQRIKQDHPLLLRSIGALLVLGGTLALVFLPSWNVEMGPFANVNDAKSYLQTLWQVLAAAVGVSVALVAFVFQAFI